MKTQQSTRDPAFDPLAAATLTAEQTDQAAGGFLIAGGAVIGGKVNTGLCCLTCGSIGRPLFSTVAAEMAT